MHLAHSTKRTERTERDRSIPHTPKRSVLRRARWGAVALASSMSVLGAGTLAGQAAAQPSHPQSPANHYEFRTLNNNNDPTFNQLLGINRNGAIAGYFGSGEQGHPNKGYLLLQRHGHRRYLNENFPGSVQTQVTGLNDNGVTVGFWSDMNNADNTNDNFGFYSLDGRHFHTVNFPTDLNNTMNATPPVNQLLGVNDRDIAVGFYTDSNGNNHGYTYSIRRHRFHEITIPGSSSVTATAINRWGDVAGFYANPNDGLTDGFVITDGNVTTLAFPGASQTQALGINDSDEVVGVYTVGSGDAATTHGFTWTPLHGFKTVDDPNGIGTTTINGVNDRGQLVGFYVDGNGNTDGMLATPGHDSSRNDTPRHHG